MYIWEWQSFWGSDCRLWRFWSHLCRPVVVMMMKMRKYPVRVDFVSGDDDDEEGPVAEGSFRSLFFSHKKGT